SYEARTPRRAREWFSWRWQESQTGALSDAPIRIHKQPAFVDECPGCSMSRIEARFDPGCCVVPSASLPQRGHRCPSIRHPMAQLPPAREDLQPTLVRIVHTGNCCEFIGRSIEIEHASPYDIADLTIRAALRELRQPRASHRARQRSGCLPL